MAVSVEARCSTCRAVVEHEPLAVCHGDLWFHGACAPACAQCRRTLRDGDTGWRCQADVVFEPWGWALRPTRFVCAACLGDAATDAPVGLD